MIKDISLWLSKIVNLYNQSELISNIILSIIVLVGTTTIYRFWKNAFSSELSFEARRKKQVTLRNNLGFIVFAILVLVWGTELKSFTLSLVAIAAAIVIATKELIMSLLGGLLRTALNRYHVGDRIEVKGVRGDVIDVTLLATTLMELSANKNVSVYTGKQIHIPHSVLLTESIHIEPKHEFVIHSFEIPVGSHDALEAQNHMAISANNIYEKFATSAEAYYTNLQNRTAIDMPSPVPKIFIYPDDKGNWWLLIRLGLPKKQVHNLQQDLIQQFLSKFNTNKHLLDNQH